VYDSDDIRIAEVGIGEASTFPGFCRVHEAEFGSQEREKDLHLHDERAWLLQFFRTVCWEIRILEHARRRNERMLASTEQRLRQSATKFVRDATGVELDVTRVGGIDWRESLMESAVARIDRMLKECRTAFLEPLQSELAGDRSPLLGALVVDVDVRIPVCLAGRGNFHILVSNDVVNVPVFLQVFPTEKSTKLAMLAAERHRDCLRVYLRTFGSPPLDLLRMVEAWMLHGTDHWFLSPSTWHALSTSRQESLIGELRNSPLSIGEPSEQTIFDDVRRRERERTARATDPFKVERR
jgi:hypothetical protein